MAHSRPQTPNSAASATLGLDRQFRSLMRLAQRQLKLAQVSIMLDDSCLQWLLAVHGSPFHGVHAASAPRPTTNDGVFIVADTHAGSGSPPSRSSPGLEEGRRFYAEYPLWSATGVQLGALCLSDHQPRQLSGRDLDLLGDISQFAAAAVEQALHIAQLEQENLGLVESERRLSLAIAGSGTGIWDRDIPSGRIHYSPGWKALLGYAESELTPLITDSYTRVHPDELAYVQATIQDHFDQKTPIYEVEHRLRCKDGSYKWVHSRGKVVSRDEHGAPLRMIGTTTDITERKQIEARLQEHANTDFLTRLPNRRYFMERIDLELKRIGRHEAKPAAVLLCDLDHFKAINDRWGHAVGDQALSHFAGILLGQLRKTDIAGRIGGEEFAIILPGGTIDDAQAFVARLQAALASTPLPACAAIALTASIGITRMDHTDSHTEHVLARCDAALYRAKTAGRNRMEIN